MKGEEALASVLLNVLHDVQGYIFPVRRLLFTPVRGRPPGDRDPSRMSGERPAVFIWLSRVLLRVFCTSQWEMDREIVRARCAADAQSHRAGLSF